LATGLLYFGARGVEAARELHARRDEWLPGLKYEAGMLLGDAKTVFDKKCHSRSSYDEPDIDRILREARLRSQQSPLDWGV
jgi:hypothetical protein